MKRHIAILEDTLNDEVAVLFREYLVDHLKDVQRDLGIVVDPEKALAADKADRGAFEPPRGLLLVAKEKSGELLGCVGLKESNEPQIGEVKRLYVRKQGRTFGQ